MKVIILMSFDPNSVARQHCALPAAGLMAATNSGRPSINPSARTAKTLNLAPADYEAEIFEEGFREHGSRDHASTFDQQRPAGTVTS